MDRRRLLLTSDGSPTRGLTACDGNPLQGGSSDPRRRGPVSPHDPACPGVWTGNRAQYEAYYHLAVEQRIEADPADSDAAAWAER
jgi:hypothetical protein